MAYQPKLKSDEALQLLPELESISGTTAFDFTFKRFMKACSESKTQDISIYRFSKAIELGVQGDISGCFDAFNRFIDSGICDNSDFMNSIYALMRYGAISSLARHTLSIPMQGREASEAALYTYVAALYGHLERATEGLDYIRKAYPNYQDAGEFACSLYSLTIDIVSLLRDQPEHVIQEIPSFWKQYESLIASKAPFAKVFHYSTFYESYSDTGLNTIEVLLIFNPGTITDEQSYQVSDWLAEQALKIDVSLELRKLFTLDATIEYPDDEGKDVA